MIGAVDAMAREGVLRMWPRPPVPGISSVIAIAGEEIHDMLAGRKSEPEALLAAQNRADALLRARGLY
jgi:multiple sugar transport system substrate-binding protein